jgi:hypothetical protein
MRTTPLPPLSGTTPELPNHGSHTVGWDADLHRQLEKQRLNALPEAALVRRYRDYVRGFQPNNLTDRAKQILEKLLGNITTDNVCRKVVHTIASRIRIARMNVADTTIATYLETVEQKTGLLSLSGKTHRAMLRDGNAAVCIGWKGDASGRPHITRELYWDGYEGTYIHYDGNGDMAYALKQWEDAEGWYRTLFYPDAILRWTIPHDENTKAALPDSEGWQRLSLPTDTLPGTDPTLSPVQTWPMPWLDDKGQPLGIPFVHFANPTVDNDGRSPGADDSGVKALGTGDAGLRNCAHHGVSELFDVLGLQDHTNAIHWEIAAARLMTAYQQSWMSGVAVTDDQNNPVVVSVGPGYVHLMEDAQARMGVLPPGDLTQLINSLKETLQAVSRNTEIPLHEFTGVWPSGAAIYQSESGLNFKSEGIKDALTPRWGSVAHWCIRLANRFGGQRFSEDAIITADFAPVSRLDPITLADTATKLADHISDQEFLRICGYSEADITKILKEREQQQQAITDRQITQEKTLADIALRRFNSGANPTPGQPGSNPNTAAP